MRYMTNKYAGECVDCGCEVQSGAGRTWKADGRWKVSHGGNCGEKAQAPERKLSFKAVYGRCEDAPCCGCCGGGNDYMSGEAYGDTFGGW